MNDFNGGTRIDSLVDSVAKANPFVVYCPQLNQLYVHQNIYGMNVEVAMTLIRLGLKSEFTLEYVGEL